ncbi:MAG: M3 family oligoendopeptidase [Janthinobacterium lividum]
MDIDRPHLDDIACPVPDRATLDTRYAALDTLLNAMDVPGALVAWDTLRRENQTWATLARVHACQDTRSEVAKTENEAASALNAAAAGHDVAFKRRLLADPDRDGLLAAVGAYTVQLWEADIAAFDPVLAATSEEEGRLWSRYMEILAAARLKVDGQEVNMTSLRPYEEHLDREIRYEAAKALYGFFGDHGAELDDIFDRLVRLRHEAALTLGYKRFTPLGYRRLRRLDYGPTEVARFRDEVVAHVVPVVARLMEERRREQGWEWLQAWDLPLHDPAGNPRPLAQGAGFVAAAQDVFDKLDGRLGALYRSMREGGFLDLLDRPGKALSGSCEFLPGPGMPFILYNLGGTHADVSVLTHEMGHAAQQHASNGLPFDQLVPTYEVAEITSMSLELLAAPHAGLLVGEAAAARFCRVQLVTLLNTLCLCALGDNFQHEIYDRPDLTSAERHAVWSSLERRYTPWVDWGDLKHPANGGLWHRIGHFFLEPFYFIDYALAGCCALQLRDQLQRDPQDAIDTYISLCTRGGSMPFAALVQSAGLRSPFESGVLAESMREVEQVLAA